MFDPRECRIRNLWGLTVVLAASMLGAGCGTSQQLVGITIEPATETFGSASTPVQDDAGLNVQLRALGTYVHPPATKDITNQVTWNSNTPQMVTVNSTGLDNSYRAGLRQYSYFRDHNEK